MPAVARPPAPALSTNADRLSTVRRRDRSHDGRFVYAVRTTGVYCRPSCASRQPAERNVSFHADPAAAQAAGYRACRRCRPDEEAARPAVAAVERACALIRDAEEPVPLAALAAAAGLSPHHFHRLFKAETGLTPRQYGAAERARRAAAELPAAGSVTEAIYAAGYSGPSRFYEGAGVRLGMTPGQVRRGGAGIAIRFAVGECSLGSVLVAATDRGVCAILLGDAPEPLVDDLHARFPAAELIGGDAGFEATVAAVVAFVEAPATGLDLPLDVRGTVFQERVWAALRLVPAGETVSYDELAALAGRPGAARAVAGACAANPLAVAIPCHRVVRKGGALSGFRWGVERKAALLAAEAA